MRKTVSLFVALILGLQVLVACSVVLALNCCPCESGRQYQHCHERRRPARRSA